MLKNKDQKNGEEKGKLDEKIEIAKNLLKEGMDIDKISRVVGLSKDEIEKLNNEEEKFAKEQNLKYFVIQI